MPKKVIAIGGGGSGSVTATAGALTSNSVVLGAGTTDTKVAAGFTTDGSKELDIGAVGVGSGVLGLKGTTSGTATLTGPAAAGTTQNPIVSSNAISVPVDTIRSLMLGTGTNQGFSIATTAGGNVAIFKTQDGGQFANLSVGTIRESSGPLSILYPSAGIFANLGSLQSLNWGSTNAFNATADSNLSRIAANYIGIGSGAQGSTAGFIKTSQTLQVTANFTTTSATLVAVTGLTFTCPASVASKWSFHCHLLYSQDTAAAANIFGIITAQTAPTQLQTWGKVNTNNTGACVMNNAIITTATSTTVITATPSAFGVIGTNADMFQAEIFGTVEAPSNASPTQFSIAIATGSASDALTIYRGSSMWVY